jgi:hypothetical protein
MFYEILIQYISEEDSAFSVSSNSLSEQIMEIVQLELIFLFPDLNAVT